MAKQDFARTKSLDAAYMGKQRENTCSSNQSQVRGACKLVLRRGCPPDPIGESHRGLICDNRYYCKNTVKKCTILYNLWLTLYNVWLCFHGSVLEHSVSSTKGCGFNSQGTHILIKNV